MVPDWSSTLDADPASRFLALRFSSRVAVCDDGGAWTYEDLTRRSAELAATMLAGRRSLAGERVVLMAGGRAYVAALFAIWRAGGVAVPLSPALPHAEREYLCTDSDAGLALVDPEHADWFVTNAATRRLRVTTTTSTGGPGHLPAVGEGPALILYTSGTTSRPKGVVLTHANLEFQTRCLCDAWAWYPDDRILHVLPLNHVHGIVNALLCALRAGAACEMLPRFDAGRVWSRLADGDVTLFTAVPTIYVRLIAAFDAADGQTRARWAAGARRARLMISGSAALPVSVLERWKAVTGHVLMERYGMTEIGMALSNPLRGERRPGTVGHPLPGVDVRLCSETGAETEPGGGGEIHVRSAGVFAEYWRRPAETAAAFTQDRWFRTGDMGSVADGYYRILGRLSVDIIKTGGERVSALEIEEVLRGHPAVADCAVVGTAHAEWGEQVSAALVLRPGHAISLEALRSWAGTRLSRFKLPGRLVVVHDLPRNALGKVVKGEVRGMFMQGTGPWGRGPGAAPQGRLGPGT